MADGFFPLTSEQQEWSARAADLAQRELAPHAAETDRTGTFPSDDLEALKKEGFWGLRVSREHGGLEQSLLTTVLMEALAKRCASTALCYKMHLEASELVARIDTPDQVERLVRPIVRRCLLHGGGLRNCRSRRRVRSEQRHVFGDPSGDGYRIREYSQELCHLGRFRYSSLLPMQGR